MKECANMRDKKELHNIMEIENCNFVKTILMLLVLVGHCTIYWTGQWFVGEPIFPSKVLSMFSEYVNTFHVHGFVLVSGYLFYYLKCEQGKYSAFIPFFVNKVRRLLVPYAFITVVWVIPITNLFFDYSIDDYVRDF